MLDDVTAITKELYRPCPNFVVQVVVYCSPYIWNDMTINPITETTKNGKRRIKISTKDYLAFHYSTKDLFETIHINHSNVGLIHSAFTRCMQYFDKELYPGMFTKTKDKGYQFNSIDYPKKGIKVGGLSGDKSIIVYPDTFDGEKGVSIMLNNPEIVVDLTQSQFEGLTWVIGHTDITSVANSMLTFVNTEENRRTANPSLRRVGGRE
jgi:hypothetical protein